MKRVLNPLGLFGLALSACTSGIIAGPPTTSDAGVGADAATSDATPRPADDAGAGDAQTTADGGAPASLACQVQALLATRCASCHTTNGAAQPAFARLEDLVGAMSIHFSGNTLVVPGNPSASLLYKKVAGLQAPLEGEIMPPGVGGTMAEIETLRAWIEDGAPTACGTPAPDAGTAWDPGPNGLDQATLFTCQSPALSSAARLRRVERREWTHSVGKPLVPTWYGSTARNNPFDAPAKFPYSTYSEDVSIDEATIELYFGVLAEAGAGWTARDGGPLGLRTYAVNTDPSLSCIFNQARPDRACVDNYVGKLLRVGVLFRDPTPEERARLVAFAENALSLEPTPGTDRTATLTQVTSAAWMMSGALFKSELGEAQDDDPTDGRRRLTSGELGRAIGGLLSTFPPGASATFQHNEGPPEHLGWTAPPEGRLGLIAAAAADGSIHRADVRDMLIDRYFGGVDPMRFDVQLELDSDKRQARGEYWLAPRVADFFREWLDYGQLALIFKDTPRATSHWDGQYRGSQQYDPINVAYTNLTNRYHGDESLLVEQLDDTIARVVLDDAAVLRNLLTTRRWRLPSNLASTNGTRCTSDSDCAGQAGYPSCADTGFCGTQSWKAFSNSNKIYSLMTDVPTTAQGRWVDMPAERGGVLTHPAWLAAHGGNFEDDPSLIRRGKWIRENLFCEPVPPLELVMVEAKLVSSAPDKSARERVVESVEQGPQAMTCMGCHGKMNSLGYPFELYNHVGMVRASDHGSPPSGQSTITNAPEAALNASVTSAVELSALLASSPHVKRCFLRQTFRFFSGRDESYADACTLAAMERAYDGQGSFKAALKALANSEPFLYRDTGERP